MEDNILKESEEKFKLILDNANDLIIILNDKGEQEYINEKAFLDFLGYSKEEIFGMSPLKPIHPDDLKIATKTIRDVFRYGECRNEMRIKHKDGHYIWFEHKGKKFIDTDGKIKAIIISRDITELKNSEEKYRSLINNLTDIILELDVNGVITYISPQCFNITGYKQDELIGKKTLKFIHPNDVLALVESMRNARDSKKMIEALDFKLLHKNGNIIFASARGKHIITNGIDRYIVTLRDITAKIKIEKKLKESETKYRLISENANDIIIILNQNLEIEYVNENPLLALTGYSIDNVIGKRVLDFIHLDDVKKALNIISEAFNKEGYGTMEARVKHKNGNFLYVEVNGSLFYNEKGEPRALLITRDITERKKAENVIIEEYKKLEDLSQIKSESIMMASHELKSPLSSIYMASQILLKSLKKQLNDEEFNFLEIIYRGSQKLSHLIDNLLDVSKLESDELKLDLKDENVVEIINDCVNDLKLRADRKEINIETDLLEGYILSVDRIRLEQVIINLLSNAIKFTPSNGNILITLKDKGKNVEISVKDTGIGLSKNEKEQLFQKFGKIHRSDKKFDSNNEGTGLGLYISREIVELHKGKIIVKSQGRNKGSTFIISLPK